MPTPSPDTFQALADQYRCALLDDVVPFWQRHSVDREYGGYFTCLGKDGSVYDTDKFIWLQNRQVWTFALLYNQVEQRADWLDVAAAGANFLAEHGRDPDGNWYFSLTRDGRPLTQPYSIFSDCFAAMAFSQYAIASGQDAAQTVALAAYSSVLRRQHSPKGAYSKAYPGTRSLQSLAVPMILANLTLEMAWLLPESQLNAVLDSTLQTVMKFASPQGILHENIAPDGTRVDCFEGRLINPGHGIEAMWFVMDIARRRNQPDLVHRAVEGVLNTLEFGWDRDHGGIFYFLDSQGHPPQQLEWSQKLWWVHLEALVALAMGYQLTGRDECWQGYQRVHDYAWSHFADPDYGEWFGYLTRQGDVLMPLKGGKWKGCFHVPRALYLCWQIFAALAAPLQPPSGSDNPAQNLAFGSSPL